MVDPGFKDDERNFMTMTAVFESIQSAMQSVPRKGYIAELRLQVIKHSESLQNVTGKEFCEILGVGPSFGAEFNKMKDLAPRLRAAGLDVNKI
ncbi:transcription factor [Loktanella agnita]|uniref:HTH-like domain-containing protein n=1 Tax=Loktanella agnita TaxID=287097 RepID=UPI0039879F14